MTSTVDASAAWVATLPECGRCGAPVEPNDGFVLYFEEGGRDAGSEKRVVVHGMCVAEDAAAGLVRRVSSFAFEVVKAA